MGDLREELLKAGLVKPKDVRRAKREARRKQSKKTTEALERERQERAARAERRREEQRRKARALQQEANRARDAREHLHHVHQLVVTGSLTPRGDRPFHFVCPDGFIRRVHVDEATARGLEHGELGIVEDPLPQPGEGRYRVVTAQTVRRLAGEDGRDRILFFQGRLP